MTSSLLPQRQVHNTYGTTAGFYLKTSKSIECTTKWSLMQPKKANKIEIIVFNESTDEQCKGNLTPVAEAPEADLNLVFHEFDRLIRKKSSVEFICEIDDKEHLGHTSPRRLTVQERKELYKVRPDLKIPGPMTIQDIMDGHKRKQRIITLCILLLTLVVLVLTAWYFEATDNV